MTDRRAKIITLCGPTGVGKTELSLRIAEAFSCEIVGVDSMQVYRYMDIGTAKPTQAERRRVPHHLIDIVDPDEHYTLGRFIKEAEEAIRTIRARGNTPLLAGGTGLYFKGLLEGVFHDSPPENGTMTGAADEQKARLKKTLRRKREREGNQVLYQELQNLDPESAARIHPNDTQRLLRALEIFYSTGIPWSRHLAEQRRKDCRFDALKIGLTRPRPELYERIDRRLEQMVGQGLVAEVEKLLAMGYGPELKAMQSIGYRHMLNFLKGTWTREEALEKMGRDTRHYAKRQYTWFNSDPEIRWFDVRDEEEIFRAVEDFMELTTVNKG
jgi:tRNA dimethylallyltransferase